MRPEPESTITRVNNDLYRRLGHAWWDDDVGEFSTIRLFMNPIRFGYFKRVLEREGSIRRPERRTRRAETVPRFLLVYVTHHVRHHWRCMTRHQSGISVRLQTKLRRNNDDINARWAAAFDGAHRGAHLDVHRVRYLCRDLSQQRAAGARPQVSSACPYRAVAGLSGLPPLYSRMSRRSHRPAAADPDRRSTSVRGAVSHRGVPPEAVP